MRMRDALYVAAVFLIGVVHFALQWMGWKEHIEEITLQGGLLGLLPEGSLWPYLSFPLFTFIPRHLQFHYFFSLLIVNSILWGVAGVVAASFAARTSRGFRYRRRLKTGKALTWADQLVDLKRQVDRGKITPEEYLRRREAILSGWSDRAIRKSPSRAEGETATGSRGRLSA